MAAVEREVGKRLVTVEYTYIYVYIAGKSG